MLLSVLQTLQAAQVVAVIPEMHFTGDNFDNANIITVCIPRGEREFDFRIGFRGPAHPLPETARTVSEQIWKP